MKFLIAFLIAALALTSPAFAQAVSDTTVTVPYGQWATDLAMAAIAAIGGAAAAAISHLPMQWRWLATVARADQLLEKALAKARSEIGAKLAPDSFTVDVRSKLLADALRYCVDQYPALVKRLGGPELVRQKLQARLQEWIEKTF